VACAVSLPSSLVHIPGSITTTLGDRRTFTFPFLDGRFFRGWSRRCISQVIHCLPMTRFINPSLTKKLANAWWQSLIWKQHSRSGRWATNSTLWYAAPRRLLSRLSHADDSIPNRWPVFLVWSNRSEEHTSELQSHS